MIDDGVYICLIDGMADLRGGGRSGVCAQVIDSIQNDG